MTSSSVAWLSENRNLKQSEAQSARAESTWHTRELISARKTSHKQTTKTWVAYGISNLDVCKYKVH